MIFQMRLNTARSSRFACYCLQRDSASEGRAALHSGLTQGELNKVDATLGPARYLMGFLKKFLKSSYRDGDAPHGVSSFQHLSEEELEAHMGVARYGDFVLTDAVRPSYNLDVIPQTGYRPRMVCRSGVRIPDSCF